MAFQIIKGDRTKKIITTTVESDEGPEEVTEEVNNTIITLEQAKANSKIDYDFEDDLLQMYVDAISDEFENYTGSIILERDIKILYPAWQKRIYLPIAPIVKIVEINYLDENGDEQTLDEEDYKLHQFGDGAKPKLVFLINEFPELYEDDENDEYDEFKVIIKVKAGFPIDGIPADIKKAALLSFSNVETFREDMPIKYNRTIYQLLGRYKKY